MSWVWFVNQNFMSWVWFVGLPKTRLGLICRLTYYFVKLNHTGTIIYTYFILIFNILFSNNSSKIIFNLLIKYLKKKINVSLKIKI